MARTGAPFELIARQLGHCDVAMVAKVYGRFRPDTEERDRCRRA
jgi:integrase